MLRSTFTFLSYSALFLSLCLLTSACSQAPSEDKAADDSAVTEAPQEPAHFRDGFESGDTSGWSAEGDDAEDGSAEDSKGEASEADGNGSH